MSHINPSDLFHYERLLRQRGRRRIAGVDEAGRGPLAGPVVAAAVMFPSEWIDAGLPEHLAGINDSKQLRPARREELYELLVHEDGIQFAIALMDAGEVDRHNILRATHLAMAKALASFESAPDHILVDGLRVALLTPPQTAIVKGDRLSYSIAAASILAKVSRDRLMMEYDKAYPQYGFARHKGYPTEAHLTALARHGPSPIHRHSFAPLKPATGELFPL